MPSSLAPSTVRRTALAPWRWPSARGRPRARAHRPLPSMMMATCTGGSRDSGSEESTARAPSRFLDLHDLLFFGGLRFVDLFYLVFGPALNLMRKPTKFVFP